MTTVPDTALETQPEKAAPQPPAAQPSILLETDASLCGLLWLCLKNAFLTLLTLGIYNFWGRTKIRRYLWERTLFCGERTEYTGRGLELFTGFILISLIVLLPFGFFRDYTINVLPHTAFGATHPALVGLITLIPIILFLYFLGVALYRQRRYRLKKTLWRGIRPCLSGSEWRYGLFFLKGTFLNLITLGLAFPYFTVSLWQRLMANTHLGGQQMTSTVSLKRIYKRFFKAIALWVGVNILSIIFFSLAVGISASIADRNGVDGDSLVSFSGLAGGLFSFVSLYVMIAWYKAAYWKELAEGLSYNGLTFTSSAKAKDFLWLSLGNLALFVITLGFGRPGIALRRQRFLCRHVTIHGDMSPDNLVQEVQAHDTGEGMADAFDVFDFDGF